MKSYPYLDRLDPFYRELLLGMCVELLQPRWFPRVTVVDYWRDDSLPCIDVKLEYRGHVVKFSIWNYSERAVAAFYFPDSPTARKLIIKTELEHG